MSLNAHPPTQTIMNNQDSEGKKKILSANQPSQLHSNGKNVEDVAKGKKFLYKIVRPQEKKQDFGRASLQKANLEISSEAKQEKTVLYSLLCQF